MSWPTSKEGHEYGIISMDDPERDQIKRFLCFLGKRHNRSPNSIMRIVKSPKGNAFISKISIYVLYIEEYESSWRRTQIYDSHILDVEREKLDLLALGKTSGTG